MRWLLATLAVALLMLALLLWQRPLSEAGPRPPAPVEPSSPAAAPQSESRASTTPDALARVELPASGTTSSTIERASLLVNVLWRETREPAPGIAFTLIPEGGGSFAEREASTDARGQARFAGLDPGRCFVLADRGTHVEVDLAAGGRQECTLELPVGIAVEGTVLDCDGVPVAGARIRLWEELWGEVQHSNAHTVAESDPLGRFRVRGVRDGAVLLARKSGYSPSLPARLHPDQTTIRLVLPARGAALRGRVSSAGRGVADAQVHASLANTAGTPYAASVFDPPRLILRTDEDGRFAGDDLPAGATRVYALAKGFLFREQGCTLATGSVTELDLELETAAVITGRITDEQQRPLAGVWAFARDESLAQRAGATSRRDGRYRIECAPRGQVTLSFDKVGYAEQRRVLEIAPDSTVPVEVDVVLAPKTRAAIRGRLQDEAEKPLAGWRIEGLAKDQALDSPIGSATVTEADGRFVLDAEPELRYTLRVAESRESRLFRPSDLPPVTAGSKELVITLRGSERPSAFVHGKLVDADGSPSAGIWVDLCDEAAPGWGKPERSGADGSFRIGPMAPGKYVLRTHAFAANAAPPADLRALELASGELLDVGTLRIPRGERLVYRWLDREGNELQEISAEICDARHERVATLPKGQGHGEQLLLPGRYLLSAGSFPSWGWKQSVPLEIRPGEGAKIELRFEPCVKRTLRLDFPREARPEVEQRAPRIAIVQANGERTEFDRVGVEPDAPVLFTYSLPVGTHRVEVTLRDGARLVGSMAVEQLNPSSAPVPVELRLVR